MFYLIVAKSIEQEDHTVVEYLMEGGRGPVKLANAVPHDLGDPGMVTFLFFFYLYSVSLSTIHQSELMKMIQSLFYFGESLHLFQLM